MKHSTPKMLILGFLTLGMNVSGCFNMPVSSKATIQNSETVARLVAGTAVSETKSVSTIDPNATTAQQLNAPTTVEGLKGASVSIAPGSLSISAELVFEQASDFSETSITSEMGLATDIEVTSTSPGMIIRPTEDVDLKKPLQLAMPLPLTLGFRLEGASSRYGIFYKYFDPVEQRLVTGLKVVDGTKVILAYDAASGRDIISFEGYFGAYWAAILSRSVSVAELPPPKIAEEPIINAAKVAVVETRGVVKEVDIQKQEQIPEVQWQKPVLKFDATARELSISAAIDVSHTVASCKVDLFENPKASSGLSFEVAKGLVVGNIAVAKTSEHSIFGRFRCIDGQGHFTVSPWSEPYLIPAVSVAVEVPVVVEPIKPPASPDPVVTPGLGICGNANSAAGFKIKGQNPSSPGTFIDVKNFVKTAPCRYEVELFGRGGGSFFIVKEDETFVCGLVSHNLTLGAHDLSCTATTPSNFGSNVITMTRGNYKLVVDFSQSEIKPRMSVEYISCSLGGMNLQVLDAAPPYLNESNFSSGSIISMNHHGACEFSYETSTKLVTTYRGAMRFSSTQGGPIFCGNEATPASGVATTGTITSLDHNVQKGICDGTRRHFQVIDMPNAQSYKYRVLYGRAANAYYPELNPATGSAVNIEFNTTCPEELFVFKPLTAAVHPRDATPIPGLNSVRREGACTYKLPIDFDAASTGTRFMVGTLNPLKICGVSSGDVTTAAPFNLDCSATALPIDSADFEPGSDELYKATVTGNGLTAELQSMRLDRQFSDCASGVYFVQDLTLPFLTPKAKSFAEIRQCVYEYNWVPSSANDGFYTLSGDLEHVCGSSVNTMTQPSLGGAEALAVCGGGGVARAGSLQKTKPLGLSAGVNYKVRVDHRLRNFGVQKIQVSPVSANASCEVDVHLTGISTTPPQGEVSSLPVAANKFQRKGFCNWTFDYTVPYTSPYEYRISIPAYGRTCVAFGNSPTLTPGYGQSRFARFDCDSSSYISPSVLYGNEGQTYRFNFSFDPGTRFADVTVQQVSVPCPLSSSNYSPYSLIESGNNLTLLPPVSGSTECSLSSYGTLGNSKLFHIVRTSGMYPAQNRICAPAKDFLNASFSSGSPQPMDCDVRPGAPFTMFGTGVDDGFYAVKINPALSYESRPLITMSRAKLLSDLPLPQIVNGSPGFKEGPNANGPSARVGSITWTTAGAMVYVFGGFGKGSAGHGYLSDLWRYDTVNNVWALINGTNASINVPTKNTDAPNTWYPGGRRDAQTWFDSVHQRLYLFGGRGRDAANNEGALADLWYYDLTSNGWILVKGSVLKDDLGNPGVLHNADINIAPAARYSAATWNTGDLLWMWGGMFTAIDTFADLWAYRISDNKWIRHSVASNNVNVAGTSSSPSSRGGAQSWYLGDTLYVLGGDISSISAASTSDFWKMQLNSNNDPVWTRLMMPSPEYFTPRISKIGMFDRFNQPGPSSYAATWIKGNQLWMFGGYLYNPYNHSQTRGQYWVYDAGINSWAYVPPRSDFLDFLPGFHNFGPDFTTDAEMIGSRARMSTWFVGGKAYLFGGELDLLPTGDDGVQETDAGYEEYLRNDLWQIELPSF